MKKLMLLLFGLSLALPLAIGCEQDEKNIQSNTKVQTRETGPAGPQPDDPQR